jgi:hypothetical protein
LFVMLWCVLRVEAYRQIMLNSPATIRKGDSL